MKNFNLPSDHRPFIDKYFLRAKEVLQKENLNPRIRAQVFIRKGSVEVYGIDEARAIITKYAKNVKIWSLKEGERFGNCEPIMIIEAPIQEIIDLETMYLGVLSAETTLNNDKKNINLKTIRFNMEKVVDLIEGRPISYFGARHWRYDRDYEIAKACFKAGAKNCSTDNGGKANSTLGIGTIPHALEAVYHWKCGLENAVVGATKAFNKHLDLSIPRIALIDYANKEITDSLMVAREVLNLDGIRIDTCGENWMECSPQIKQPIHYKTSLMYGKGVSIFGVLNLKHQLNAQYPHVKVILSSGFGNPNKVKEFVRQENALGFKLFDGLGVGGVFYSRMATMDIIEVEGQEIHKVGRLPKLTNRLKRVI